MDIKLKTKANKLKEDFERDMHNKNVEMLKIIKMTKAPEDGNMFVEMNMTVYPSPHYFVRLTNVEPEETETSKVLSVGEFKKLMRGH